MFYISAGGNQIYKPLDDLLVLFNPKLTLEIGKAGALEFDIPPVNPYYDRLTQLTTEVTVEMDSEEIFHGRVLSIDRSFNNIRHVYCEGDLAYLIDSVQKGVQYRGTTHDLFSRIIANHNARVDANKRFTVGTVNIENRSIVLVGQSDSENINTGNIDYKQIAIDSIVDEWNNSFDYIQTCLIDYCGGYLRTRRVNGTLYIDLLDDFGNTAVQPIELGRNLLDLSEEVSAEDVFTVLIPLGDDNLTIASVNGGSDELIDTASVKRFGRIVRTHVFNNVTSASTLLENARRFLATNSNIPRTISVRAVDLHLINKSIPAIKIGDKVAIASYVHDVNDVLTCTKIEYDLEKPENNNYTFGNPKQTLTQRYREDERFESDTYGNSAVSPVAAQSVGQASAASVGAAGLAAVAEQKKALDAFYETWIKDGEEPGKVSLGALYRQFYDGKEVLLSQCGIDLDGKTGNVNITSMHKQVNEYGKELASNEARIAIVETDTAVAIENMTDRVDTLGGVEAQHHTEIVQTCDNLSSRINLLAQDINAIDNKTTNAIANIALRADDVESRVTTTAGYITTIDGREAAHYATIQAWANEKESAIALKADKIELDGFVTTITQQVQNLMSGNATAQHLLANEITASDIYLKVGTGKVQVAHLSHSHSIDTKENDDGTITISIGTGTYQQIPQQASFKIADTKYFKDHASAGNVESLEIEYTYDEIIHNYKLIGKALDKDGTIVYQTTEGQWNTDRSAYIDGKDDGARTAYPQSVTIDPVGTPTWNEDYGEWQSTTNVSIIASAPLSDGSTYYSSTRTLPKTIDVTAAYEAGLTAGGSSAAIQDFRFNPDGQYAEGVGYQYRPGNKTYVVYVRAVLADGTYKNASSPLTMPASAAWNDGKDAGAETAYPQSVTIDPVDTPTWNEDYGEWQSTANVSIIARGTRADGSNYISATRTLPKTIDVTAAYEAGLSAGSIDIQGFNFNPDGQYAEGVGYQYRPGNKTYAVYVRATFTDGSYKNASIPLIMSATAAWNDGKDAGAETARVSRVNIGTVEAPTHDDIDDIWNSYVNLTATALGTYANGNTYTNNQFSDRQLINVTAVYEAGKAAGTGSPIQNARAKRTGTNDFIFGDTSVDVPVRIEVYNADSLVTPFYTDTDQVNVDDVVNMAWNLGAETAYPTSVTIDPVDTPTWNEDYGEWQSTANVSIIARGTRASGDTYYYSPTRTLSKTIDVTAAYEAGLTAGSSSSSITISTVDFLRKGTNDWYANGNKWYIPVRGYVRTSNDYIGPFDGGVSIMDVVEYLSNSSHNIQAVAGGTTIINGKYLFYRDYSCGSSSIRVYSTARLDTNPNNL